MAIDLDRGWRLHPQVAVRPEPFGALLYHFGTPKAVVPEEQRHPRRRSIAGRPRTLRAALSANGLEAGTSALTFQALEVLANSNMVIQRDSQ